jgi:hypothetical protein
LADGIETVSLVAGENVITVIIKWNLEEPEPADVETNIPESDSDIGSKGENHLTGISESGWLPVF